MQLVTILIPQMAKVQKEGESGRKKINQWTRYLTVIVTAFQAAAYIGYLKSPANAGSIDSILCTVFLGINSNYTYSRNIICNVAW
ncbi:MAG: hypothetical protein WDM71_07885 [Ferruginibacter sp.]